MTRLIKAERLPCGRIRIALSMADLRVATFMVWDMVGALVKNEARFGRLSLDEMWSFGDEVTTIVFYGLDKWPRRFNERTGEFRPAPERRRAGTAWDELPRMEAVLLPSEDPPSADEPGPDRVAALTLPREKLLALADSCDVSLARRAPSRSEAEEEEFRARFVISTQEAEEFRDEIRRVEQNLRI